MAVIKSEVIGSDELKAFMEQMGWNEREALGALTLLWHGSQKRELEYVTVRQVGLWCRAKDAAEAEKIAAALSDELVGFLRRRGRGRFFVVGNRKHIDRLKTLKESSRSGGEKTKKKWLGAKTKSGQAQDAEPNGLADGVANGPADGQPNARLLSSPSPTLPNLSSSSPSPSPLSSSGGAADVDEVTRQGQAKLEEIRKRLARGEKDPWKRASG